MRRAPVMALLLLLPHAPGCLVSSIDGETAEIVLAVDVPAGEQPVALGGATGPWDKQGLFHLQAFPKLVRVAVEHKDYELLSATWPDPQRGIGGGEGPEGEVEVVLDVPAGTDRRLTVLGFVVDLGGVLVYREERAELLTLAAGQSQALAVQMLRVDTGHVDLTVRCQQGNMGSWDPVQASLVDARAQVVFPPVTLEEERMLGYLFAELSAVPVGRYFSTRVLLRHAGSGAETTVQVIKPTFVVKTPNERVPVNLTIPCGV